MSDKKPRPSKKEQAARDAAFEEAALCIHNHPDLQTSNRLQQLALSLAQSIRRMKGRSDA